MNSSTKFFRLCVRSFPSHGARDAETEDDNRDLENRFGTKAYAAEELVAELGAAFQCAHLNIRGELKHSEYTAN
jgi:antirestriction protein ArdC